jgi:hypothetical protein
VKYIIEVMRGPAPTYIVNGKAVGRSIASVRRVIEGPDRLMVETACRTAKDNNETVFIAETILGWRSWTKLV